MISPDLPIENSSEDMLNRGSFVKHLSQVITRYSSSSSFSIGLYGKWGSGKTSLLNMVLENVEKSDDSIIVLRFNPWLCADSKQLITQFFKQLATAIKLKKSAANQAWTLIDQYADIFDAANLVPGAGAFLAVAGKAFAAKAKKHIAEQDKDLQGKKDTIISKMKEEKLRIVVSIDDIDRLSEEEIIAVFQLVKALADFPNTVYLLAFDYDVVVKALKKVQNGDGKEYLEKVIQVPFEIPAPNMQSIHNALFSKLNVILGELPEERWDKIAWAELFQFGIKEYIKSIRDVIRYANVFFIKYELLKDETDPVDLLGLTCLQVFEPSIYSKLPNYKETLCGANSNYSYESQKTEEEKVKKTVEALISDNEMTANIDAAKRILGILFPKTQVAISGFGMGRYYVHKNFLVSNSIAASMCFDRYFSLTLEDDAIPTIVIKQLIYDADEQEFTEGIRRIYQAGKIVRLLDEIDAYATTNNLKNVPVDRAQIIIKCLARQWSSFEVDDGGFLSFPFAWRLLFCVEPLLESIEQTLRYPFLRSVFEDYDVQPSTLAVLLHNFEMRHGRFTEKGENEGEKYLSLDQLLELEQIFKSRAIDVLSSKVGLEQRGSLNFLWMLEQLEPEFVKSEKKKIITDDILLVRVLSLCTTHGTALVGIERKFWKINREIIEEFIDANEAYQRVSLFVNESDFAKLPVEDQMDAIAFLIDMEREQKKDVASDEIFEDAIRKKMKELSVAHVKD